VLQRMRMGSFWGLFPDRYAQEEQRTRRRRGLKLRRVSVTPDRVVCGRDGRQHGGGCLIRAGIRRTSFFCHRRVAGWKRSGFFRRPLGECLSVRFVLVIKAVKRVGAVRLGWTGSLRPGPGVSQGEGKGSRAERRRRVFFEGVRGCRRLCASCPWGGVPWLVARTAGRKVMVGRGGDSI
jgi:hypothetical protein